MVDAGPKDVERLELFVPILGRGGKALDGVLLHQAELRIDVGLLLLVGIRVPGLQCVSSPCERVCRGNGGVD